MHKLSSLLLAAAMISLPTVASAGMVTSVGIGVAMPSLEVNNFEEAGDSGFDIGGSIGFRFSDMVQWDTLEFHYLSADQNDGFGAYEANNLAVGTGFRVGSFGGESRLHPYASFGIGGSRTTIEGAGVYAWQWGFEWNAGVGLLYDISDQMALGVRYRYRSTSIDYIFGVVLLDDVSVNIHTIGLEFAFGN